MKKGESQQAAKIKEEENSLRIFFKDLMIVLSYLGKLTIQICTRNNHLIKK